MKVYIDPDVPMLQKLVVQIQGGIGKLPLSISDSLRRMSDVVKAKLERYSVSAGKVRTEAGFIQSQPRDQQAPVKREYLDDLLRQILMHEDNRLRPFIAKGRNKQLPLSDKVVVSKMIKPLFCSELLALDMDNDLTRDNERRNILVVLNTIADTMLDAKWRSGDRSIDSKRAENFLYQGSIGWWMSMVLVPAIKNYLHIPEAQKGRLLARRLDPDDEERLKRLVKGLCSWDIWSTSDGEELAAMRSNTVKNVAERFAKYTDVRLVNEVVG
jgi:hypothetical protein